MPNWCSNTFIARGEPDKLKEFMDEFPKDDNDIEFTFNAHYPMPAMLENTRSPMLIISDEEYKAQEEKFQQIAEGKVKQEIMDSRCLTKELSDECKEKYKYDNWYDWCVENWGCKWDASEIEEIENSDDYFEVNFDSPWSPPMGWFKKICKDYPDVDFKLKYEEEGMGFFGRMKSTGDGEFIDSCIED